LGLPEPTSKKKLGEEVGLKTTTVSPFKGVVARGNACQEEIQKRFPCFQKKTFVGASKKRGQIFWGGSGKGVFGPTIDLNNN